jgi:2-methylaconitate cis-trans-isomerase PrpF
MNTSYLAAAAGSPSPTLVIDASALSREEPDTLAAVRLARRALLEHGLPHVLKFALVRPSEHPVYDVEYQFVQCLPGDPDQFDLRGSCGHSILAAVVAVERFGWVPPLTPSKRVRVDVVNNGDTVVCEADSLHREGGEFTVHFVYPDRPLDSCLLTGAAHGTLPGDDGQPVPVSMVSVGNPYVFVPATALGIGTEEELFGGGEELLGTLRRLRERATDQLGWPAGAFPKVACVGAFRPGALSVRAVSVPSWHPTLALTGAICLAVAATIPDTVPGHLARQADCPPGPISLRTPGGQLDVTVSVQHTDGPRLSWVSVGGKAVRMIRPTFVPELAALTLAASAP